MNGFVISVLVLVGIGAGISPARAEVQIEDRGRVLEYLDLWARGVDFDSSFQCGQQASYTGTISECNYNCNDYRCISTCSYSPSLKFKLQVEDCSTNQVSIYGQNGLEIRVNREEYRQAGNTWVLGFLRSHGHFVKPAGKVVLESAMPRTLKIVSGGEVKEESAVFIVGSIFGTSQVQGAMFELFVLPQKRGLNQMALFRDDYEDYYMKLRGVQNPTTPGF